MRIQTHEFDVELDLRAIELLSFSMDSTLVQKGHLPTHDFQIKIDDRIDLANSLVLSIINIEIIRTDDENARTIGKISVSCIFEVPELDEIAIPLGNGAHVVPPGLLNILHSIAVSTTRGVMFSTFMGTPLHGVVLPVVDPKGFKYVNQE